MGLVDRHYWCDRKVKRKQGIRKKGQGDKREIQRKMEQEKHPSIQRTPVLPFNSARESSCQKAKKGEKEEKKLPISGMRGKKTGNSKGFRTGLL